MNNTAAKTTQQKVRTLRAYRIHDTTDGDFLPIVPASADREWMDIETGGWANRCLPLRIANQAGWWILNDADFEVRWSGRRALEGVQFRDPEAKSYFVHSMFGHGIITWVIPYLFRTEPDYNMWVKGPSNLWKDGVTPLEGLIETDWMSATFTMNWKLTRPGKWVKFRKGDPIAMLVPVRRHVLETFQPEIRNLESEPELLEKYRAWHRSRVQTVERAKNLTFEEKKVQGHYIRGEHATGERAPEHQNKIALRDFREVDRPLKEPPVRTARPAKRRSWIDRLLAR
jgi:hypothetical protein